MTPHQNSNEAVDEIVLDFTRAVPPPKSEMRERLLSILSDERRRVVEEKRDLLDRYSRFLEKYGYMDTDWWAEEPNAVDRFLTTLEEEK